ncbi:MAG: glycosyltransferase [Lachnospiraceae bacterium]
MERQELLSIVAERFGLDLYTPDKNYRVNGCTNHGPVDYYDYAPYVFKEAKINLNISLRSILSGIPLRAFDIMGAGGFLMTNFQTDFLDYFVPGEDYVYYDSPKDLLDKTAYYLRHEEERAAIAKNGLQKITADHTYIHRVKEILSYLPN